VKKIPNLPFFSAVDTCTTRWFFSLHVGDESIVTHHPHSLIGVQMLCLTYFFGRVNDLLGTPCVTEGFTM
jgi:hypothetical protein